jgi:hypothetical protein
MPHEIKFKQNSAERAETIFWKEMNNSNKDIKIYCSNIHSFGVLEFSAFDWVGCKRSGVFSHDSVMADSQAPSSPSSRRIGALEDNVDKRNAKSCNCKKSNCLKVSEWVSESCTVHKQIHLGIVVWFLYCLFTAVLRVFRQWSVLSSGEMQLCLLSKQLRQQLIATAGSGSYIGEKSQFFSI